MKGTYLPCSHQRQCALEGAKADLLMVQCGIFNVICALIKHFNASLLGFACRASVVKGNISSIKHFFFDGRVEETSFGAVTSVLVALMSRPGQKVRLSQTCVSMHESRCLSLICQMDRCVDDRIPPQKR